MSQIWTCPNGHRMVIPWTTHPEPIGSERDCDKCDGTLTRKQ